jgi:hypothetical protein
MYIIYFQRIAKRHCQRALLGCHYQVMNSAFVILDSSALIAQINVKDLWHQKANTISEFIERTDRNVILPAEVLAETLNRIGNNIGSDR